jgi:hypothetical protein
VGTKDPNAQRDVAFEPGAPLEPAAALVAWLDAHAGALLRVPLVLVRDGLVFSARRARIGSLDVIAGDAALGISLMMRTHSWRGETCAFLAEGYWRGGDERATFDVVHTTSRPIEPSALAAITHVEIARRSDRAGAFS